MKIDANFIERWEPKYDELESDEDEYQALIGLVREEIETCGSIEIDTFKRIINWKSPRAKGKIKWNLYSDYDKAFKRVLAPKCRNKMEKLVALCGIGAPVASTILHFMFSETFPIYDCRTTEALNSFGYLESKTVSPARYPEFQKAILRIKGELVRYSLRQIDRALFAYHKTCFGKTARRVSKCSVSVVRRNTVPEIVRAICEELGANGEEISRKDIIEEAAKYGIKESSVLPADYCDNTTTSRWSKHSFLYSVGPGRYVLAKFKSKYGKMNI